jgi:transposase
VLYAPPAWRDQPLFPCTKLQHYGTTWYEFRSRLLEGNAELRLLELFLERCREGGWLKARGRQRTDSAHVLAKIRALNRVLCVAQTMVYVLNILSEVAPEWVCACVPADWVERYGERLEHERLPLALYGPAQNIPGACGHRHSGQCRATRELAQRRSS